MWRVVGGWSGRGCKYRTWCGGDPDSGRVRVCVSWGSAKGLGTVRFVVVMNVRGWKPGVGVGSEELGGVTWTSGNR